MHQYQNLKVICHGIATFCLLIYQIFSFEMKLIIRSLSSSFYLFTLNFSVIKLLIKILLKFICSSNISLFFFPYLQQTITCIQKIAKTFFKSALTLKSCCFYIFSKKFFSLSMYIYLIYTMII